MQPVVLHEESSSGKQHQTITEKDLKNILAPKSRTAMIPSCTSFPQLHSKNVIEIT